jgi:hypothetical protein
MTRINLCFKLLVLLCVASFVSGCASTAEFKYVRNAIDLVDLLDKGGEELFATLKVKGTDRLALVNIDGDMDPTQHPGDLVYDMLAMALTKKGVTVVERDREPLAAALIEGWADQLPFYLSPVSEGHEDLAQPDGAPDYADLLTFGLPGWVQKDGSKIVAEPMAATHILGYRLLDYGVSIEPAADKDFVNRIARADILLRLVNARYGTVQWAERVQLTDIDEYPAERRRQLEKERFEYSGPQMGTVQGGKKAARGPAAPDEAGGGLLNALKKVLPTPGK